MINLDDLVPLSLGELAAFIMAELPRLHGMPSQDWYSLISGFSTRVGVEDQGEIAENIELVRTAYEALLAAAVADGGLSHREATIRRVDMLVALSADATSQKMADELATVARKLALENVPMPIDRVRLKAQGWETLPIDEIRELRFVKNLFASLRCVAHLRSSSTESVAVNAWLDVWPDLP